MESSDNIDPETWSQMKRYVLEATKEFNLSPSSVRVALVNAGEDAKLVLPLNEGTSKTNVLKKVSSMKRVNGDFDVDSAFDLINSHLDENRDNKAAKVVLNLMSTTSDPYKLNKIEARINELKKKDVSVKSIQLSPDVTEPTFDADKLAIKDGEFFPSAIAFLFDALSKASSILTFLFCSYSCISKLTFAKTGFASYNYRTLKSKKKP